MLRTYRLKQMAQGKSTTAIDTNSDSVYRYGYGSPSETDMRLLDADATAEYAANNNTHDGTRSPRSVSRRRSGVMLYTPNDSLPDGGPLSANTNGREGAGSIAMASYTHERDAAAGEGGRTTTHVSDSAGSELTANTVVADELARVVWDLSTAAEMSPEQTTENDLQLLRQMADDAKELQRQLMDQLSTYAGGNEEVFAAALASNDALQNVLSSYENIMMRVTYARQHAAAVARKASLPSGSGAPQTSVPAVVPDLMSFDSVEFSVNSLEPPSAPLPPSDIVQGTPATFTPPETPYAVTTLPDPPANVQVPIPYQPPPPPPPSQQQPYTPHNT